MHSKAGQLWNGLSSRRWNRWAGWGAATGGCGAAEALIAALEGTLGELDESLTSLTAAPDIAGAAPIQGEVPDLVPQLDRLKGLLEDYDGGAVDLVSEIESQAAHTEFARPLRKIAESIDDFEFDEALELLNALREGMGLRMSDSATLT